MHKYLLSLALWCHVAPTYCENDIIIMEDYVPEKGQGRWFVLKRSTNLFDDIKCIKFELHHDEATNDIYNMTTWWINSKEAYEKTSYSVVDDRNHPARFYFASHRDKIAFQVLGTDYDNWKLTHGRVGPREAYGLWSRTKFLPDQHWVSINKVISKNHVTTPLVDVQHADCPQDH